MRAAALALLCGCGVSQGKATGTGGMFDVSWAGDPVWDDGLAEVALYDATFRPVEEAR